MRVLYIRARHATEGLPIPGTSMRIAEAPVIQIKGFIRPLVTSTQPPTVQTPPLWKPYNLVTQTPPPLTNTHGGIAGEMFSEQIARELLQKLQDGDRSIATLKRTATILSRVDFLRERDFLKARATSWERNPRANTQILRQMLDSVLNTDWKRRLLQEPDSDTQTRLQGLRLFFQSMQNRYADNIHWL